MEVGGWGVLSVVCVKGSQWMSPLIHFLIKQPALCLSHGLYPSPGLVLWADVARIDTHTQQRYAHSRTHSPLRCMKASPPPPGWTGIISSRWFMIEMGNVFSRTTWVTSFSRPENKYRPPLRTLALARVVLASQWCASHTSPTLLFRAPRGAALPLYPVCPCEVCVHWCICKRLHSHMHVNGLCFR